MASRLNLNGISIRLAAIALLMMLNASTSEAQDQTNFTHFFINPYVLNSSYAGMDGQPSASVIYRQQWMTIDGAPTITNLSLHAPMKGRLSGGVNINNDSKGFFSNTTLLFSVAYHVPVQDQSFLRFGLSAGGSWNTVDMQKLEDFTSDPALGDALDKNASLAGNAGISFHHRTFNLGVSLPAIFSPRYVSDESFNVREVKPFQAMVVHATNRFYFNSGKNIFEPYLLYYANMDLPSQFEFAGIVHLNHLVWAGGSYKQYFGISALGGIKLKNSLAIGASYSIQQSGVDQLNSPSFEVSLNYLFGKRRRDVPVYSFVNAVESGGAGKTGAAQRAATWRQKQVEAQKQRREEAEKLRLLQEEKRRKAAAKNQKAPPATKKQPLVETKKQDPSIAKKPDQAIAKKEEPVEPETQEQVIVKKVEPKGQEQAMAKDEEQVEPQAQDQAIAKKEEQAEETKGNQTKAEQTATVPASAEQEGQRAPEPKEQQSVAVEPVKIDDAEVNAVALEEPNQQSVQGQEKPGVEVGKRQEPSSAAPSVRHETFQRGDHPQELAASEYVVVGAFRSIGNARHFSDGLRSLNYNTRFGYLTPSDLWYVYIVKSDDLQKASNEQQRISKLFLFRDAWLLTVEP